MAWTQADELRAVLIELFDRWGRFHAQQWGAKPSDLGKPIRIPRPGEAEPEAAPQQQKRQVTTDGAAIRRWFGKHMKGR